MSFLRLYATIHAELYGLLFLFNPQRDLSYEADMLGYAIEDFLWPV